MEEVIAFGDAGDFGILTRARGTTRGATVVLLNAGLIHRPGPLRLHVDLADHLAASGFDVFRFDLPGVGDAGMRGAATAKVAQVFDVLAFRTGNARFLVGGICSAADLGWRMATIDDRVAGLLLIDPLAVKGGWYRIGRLQMLLRMSPFTLLRKLGRRLSRLSSGEAPPPAAEDYRDWPTPDEFRAGIARALDRGVRVLGFYTGGVTGYLLHRRQLAATYGRLRGHAGLRLEFHPELDHILFAARDRRRVVEAIGNWAGEAMEPASAG
jgi:hypothetical protein